MISARQRALAAAKAAFDKKGLDTLVLDVRGKSTITDFIVLCTARSDVHLRSVAEAVEERLDEMGDAPLRREGYQEGVWILLDYQDVMIHVIQLKQRAFYNLEKLWKGSKTVVRYE